MQIRAAAFDIDGTLYPSYVMYLRSSLRSIPRVRFLRAYSRIRKQIRRIHPIDDFETAESELLAELMSVTPKTAREMISEWRNSHLDKVYRQLKPFPHVRSCIEELRNAGLKTAVMSDFPVGNKLEYLGLDGLWDCELASEDSGYLKPRAEPFQMVADCLGESAEHIVYIGNNYEYDIVGARNAGMLTAYLSGRFEKRRESTFTFTRYRNLASTILEFVR